MADTKIVINCETGEVQEVELTEEEIAQKEADMKMFAEQDAQRELEKIALQTAKESAHAKLTALGLTAEEIEALSK